MFYFFCLDKYILYWFLYGIEFVLVICQDLMRWLKSFELEYFQLLFSNYGIEEFDLNEKKKNLIKYSDLIFY